MRHALALLLAATLLACGSQVGSDEASDGPDPDTTSADALTSTRDFKDPHVSPGEADAIVARYAFVDPEHTVAAGLLRDALVYYDVNRSHLGNPGHMAVVDFSINDTKKRLFLIDMKTGRVAPHAVAHGEASDDGSGNAVRFSNVDNSHESSLGPVLANEIYYGKFGRSARLDGLTTTNSNIRMRAIVLHGYDAVHETPTGEQGKSLGCFALDFAVTEEIVTALGNGGLIYAGLGAATK